MKKNFLNLSKNFFKLFLVVIGFLLLKKCVDVEFMGRLKLLSQKIFSSSINIEVKINIDTEQYKHLRIYENLTINVNQCSFVPPGLVGKIKIDHTKHTEDQLEKKFSRMFPIKESGGHWRPENCESRYKVAIIVPYRDRYKHLLLFLNHMHNFLQKQQLDYAIYIIEQVKNVPFNRATLLNIGYREAVKDYDWDCLILHDVDLVPEDDRNLYYCPFWPRHMSIAVNTLRYVLPYKEIFGGVSAIRRDHFELINGYSNSYFGWGGEDDDFAHRILSHGLKIIRYPSEIARYFMLLHSKDVPSTQRFNLLVSAKERFKTDGLNSLEYKVIEKQYRRLYTWMLVSFDQIESN